MPHGYETKPWSAELPIAAGPPLLPRREAVLELAKKNAKEAPRTQDRGRSKPKHVYIYIITIYATQYLGSAVARPWRQTAHLEAARLHRPPSLRGASRALTNHRRHISEAGSRVELVELRVYFRLAPQMLIATFERL